MYTKKSVLSNGLPFYWFQNSTLRTLVFFWLGITMILLGIHEYSYPLNITVSSPHHYSTVLPACHTTYNVYIPRTPPIYDMIYDIQFIHDIWCTMYAWHEIYIAALPAYQKSVYLSLGPPSSVCIWYQEYNVLIALPPHCIVHIRHLYFIRMYMISRIQYINSFAPSLHSADQKSVSLSGTSLIRMCMILRIQYIDYSAPSLHSCIRNLYIIRMYVHSICIVYA